MSSSTAPIIASSTTSTTMSLASREMTDNHRLFQFYLESFFKIPKDISHDIIYCQRALKAHIKVHQMVLDVFQQQPDADPQQKKRILDELEGEIYEINAEQNFLFLRLRRIIDEFMKMLKKNDIPTDSNTTNAFVSKELVPLINDPTLEIIPTTVIIRNTEEKLIEKYFEVQKDTKPEPVYDNMEIIELDDDEESKMVEQKFSKAYGHSRFGNRKEHLINVGGVGGLMGESLLKNLQANMAAQPSLLKPFNQRMTNDLMTLDVKPNLNKPVKTLGDLYKRKKEEKLINQRMAQELMAVDVKPNIIKPVKTLGDLYQQKKEEKEKTIELPVSTNVKMSRMNLRQALKRAQAQVRGPIAASIPAPPPPPPPVAPVAVAVAASAEVVKKSNVGRTRATRAAVAAAAAAAVNTASSGAQKSPERSSSSEEGTPERGHTPPHNYWPDEFEETRTKAEEYGQEMFLRLFDLFTPEIHAQLQQRRSKRRRRCVQNNSYHYGRLEHLPATTQTEPDNKKKRKNFLLSPQVKKALPAKRTKRRSADNVSETNSAPPSRSTSSSPDEKRSCNECLKTGTNLEQCEECKLYYHPQCHREDDDVMIVEDPKENLNDLKKCPGCKRKHDKAIKEELIIHRRLQSCAQDLELQLAKEKDRNEILQRTGKSYKIQMNNIFKIVNSFKTETTSTSQSSAIENMIYDVDEIM
ncbi:uncharacterized protein LOC119611950 [Lucilia sericata]|uniref:uncharacterized protein LOC119611950 n=1 Tax=Lucilia sericata TaxID=13632 RepID=UPI0018A858C2|nr:uncharacterized protein LOC119611950 [Lucilia sericata]